MKISDLQNLLDQARDLVKELTEEKEGLMIKLHEAQEDCRKSQEAVIQSKKMEEELDFTKKKHEDTLNLLEEKNAIMHELEVEIQKLRESQVIKLTAANS